MKFYELSKEERKILVNKMEKSISKAVLEEKVQSILRYTKNNDTYIRKNAYLILSRLYRENDRVKDKVLKMLNSMFKNSNEKVRQTSVYAMGEIGKIEAEVALPLLEKALFDEHHSVRNAVIGSLKQMGEKNPKPTLKFAKQFLKHPDPKVRREIVHGIELRGRKYPQDILPLLKEVQHDPDKRVRETLIHVLSQISYKKGCLEMVIQEIQTWPNRELTQQAAKVMIAVHKRYEKFSAKSAEAAKQYIQKHLN